MSLTLNIRPVRKGEYFKLPTKNFGDAGYDLYSAADVVVEPHGKALVKTNIAIQIPFIDGVNRPQYYLRIAPRSSVAWKMHTDIGAGVIDTSYRGEIGVIIFNHGSTPVEFKIGDRVAQFIIEKYYEANMCAVDEFSDDTDRGAGGFGSTGR